MNQSSAPQQPAEPIDLLRQGCERPWEVAVPPFQIAPSTWYVGNSWVGAYLIETTDGLILIDATMQAQVYLLFESIRKLGFDPGEIKLLLLSHAHYDHCGGARAVIESSGAKLLMSKEDREMMLERPELILTDGYPYADFDVGGYFSDSSPIEFGGMRITTIHTPGHTPGTTSFFFDEIDSKGNRYRCGLHGGVGTNTLTDEFLTAFGLPVSHRQNYLDSMLKVKELEVDITLGSHPGQVGMIEKADKVSSSYNPFVDKSVWPKLIDERIGMVRKLMDG